MTAPKKNTATLTIEKLEKQVAKLKAQLAEARGTITSATTKGALGNTRYNVAGIKKDGLSYTPDAVDAIRLYTWPQMSAGASKKEVVAALIDQGFNKATVRARVKRIFDGTEESCHSEAIRARLGLDEADEIEGEDEE
jgi:ribosomal protein L29